MVGLGRHRVKRHQRDRYDLLNLIGLDGYCINNSVADLLDINVGYDTEHYLACGTNEMKDQLAISIL